MNSLSKAVKEAKEKTLTCLFLKSGVHDEDGEWVTIDFALKVIGQNKVTAGYSINGDQQAVVSLKAYAGYTADTSLNPKCLVIRTVGCKTCGRGQYAVDAQVTCKDCALCCVI